jgi:glycosyltransferase involved in cell wall biosynthesis
MTTTAKDLPATTVSLARLMAAGELPQTPADGEACGRRVVSLSVVVPARNEAAGLGPLLASLHATLRSLQIRYEVLVVDDGSTDATGALAERAGATVIRHPESLGNGAAVKRGIRAARHEWILLLDGDGQHPPAAIPSLLALAETHDMVVGSRGGGGGDWHRNLANRIYNSLASYVTNRRIPDLTSGFRLVRADAARAFVYLLPNTFSYPTTITLALLRAGFSVGYVPFEVQRRRGRSHIRLLRDGSRFVLIILRIATFFAPLRVFLPLSLLLAATGVGYYLYTYVTAGRFTNMGALLLTQATIVFVLGLISEQVAALRFERSAEKP